MKKTAILLSLICAVQILISPAYAYTRIRGGCQYFDLEKTYEVSDLVFIGFLTSNTYNHSEPIDEGKLSTQIINDQSPVRVSRDLTFNVLQAWKGFDAEKIDNKTITIRERYLMLLKSRFEVGNTYLLFMNKKDEFGDEGWRLYECSKYEDLGRGNAHYIADFLEKTQQSAKDKKAKLDASVFVTPGTLGNRKIFE